MFAMFGIVIRASDSDMLVGLTTIIVITLYAFTRAASGKGQRLKI